MCLPHWATFPDFGVRGEGDTMGSLSLYDTSDLFNIYQSVLCQNYMVYAGQCVQIIEN